MKTADRWALAVLVLLLAAPLRAGQPKDPSLLTVERIFASGEFGPEGFAGRWLKDGSGYATLEPSKEPGGGQDIVRHDAGTGKREVLVPAAHLVPPGESAPLKIEGYSFSENQSLVLIYTQ